MKRVKFASIYFVVLRSEPFWMELYRCSLPFSNKKMKNSNRILTKREPSRCVMIMRSSCSCYSFGCIGISFLFHEHNHSWSSCDCNKRFLHAQTSVYLSDAPASHHHPNQLPQNRDPPWRRLTSVEGQHSHLGLTGVANPAHTGCTTRVAHTVGFFVALDSHCAVTVALQRSRRLRSRVAQSAAVHF